MFQRYAASVLYRSCKTISRCCTCCNDYTCMFKIYVLNVFICFRRMWQIFSSGCCKSRSRCCVHMYVATTCFKCLRCFIHMLQVFYLDVAYVLQWLHTYFSSFFFGCFASVSDVCCNCFSCFRTYVASVSSKGYKSKLGVVHVVIGPTYHSRLLQLLGRRHGSPCGRLTPANASTAWHAQAGAVIRTHVDFYVRARWSGETKQARW
jgi:hypothetical protein